MPLYANIGGAQKEITHLYANIGGAQKELDGLYANIGGAQKEIFRRGNRFYKIAATSGAEFHEGNRVDYSYGFKLNANNGSFSLNPVRSGTSFPERNYYFSLGPLPTSTDFTLKRADNDVEPISNVSYKSWSIDFGSTSPNAVEVVWLPTVPNSYFIGYEDYYDTHLYISCDHTTFYRWGNGSPGYETEYWFRTFDSTPTGFVAESKIIL